MTAATRHPPLRAQARTRTQVIRDHTQRDPRRPLLALGNARNGPEEARTFGRFPLHSLYASLRSASGWRRVQVWAFPRKWPAADCRLRTHTESGPHSALTKRRSRKIDSITTREKYSIDPSRSYPSRLLNCRQTFSQILRLYCIITERLTNIDSEACIIVTSLKNTQL